MFLELILGGMDTDRTMACFMQMKEFRGKYPDKKLIMIVPDQYSYTAERILVDMFGGAGLGGVEVLTFSRLAYRVRREVNPPKYLTPAGKQMLLYKAILNTKDESHIFDECRYKSGFVDTMAQLIGEMQRYEVTPDMLTEKSNQVQGDMLKSKLLVIADVYNCYNDLLGDNFSDSDNDMDMVADYIESTDFLNDTIIWIDEFSDFLPQNYRVIESIIKHAEKTIVTLCIPTDDEYDPQDDTFDVSRNTYSKIKHIAKNSGVGSCEIFAPKKRDTKPLELTFLQNNWCDSRCVYKDYCENISIFQGKDPYSEVSYIAGEIIRLTRNGYRFRDIGVLCGATDEYNHLIEAVFEAHDIAYFSDQTMPASSHPIIVLVSSLFRILTGNWQCEDIIRYLRTGFIYREENGDIKRAEYKQIDRLENYLLKNGIRGKAMWTDNQKWYDKPVQLFDDAIGRKVDNGKESEIDLFRRWVFEPINKFESGGRGKKTFRKIATALFSFFENIHLAEGLELEATTLLNEGNVNDSERIVQVWGILVEVIDQIVEALGDESCDLKTFGEFIQTGLLKCDIRIIPSALDQVMISSVDRSRNSGIRHLFVLGANYGKIPRESKTEGILSDRDRNDLLKIDLEIAPDTRTQNEASQFKLYKAICSAEDSVHFTYALADSENSALRPAQFLLDIKDQFKNIKCSDDVFGDSDSIAPSKKVVFQKLMHSLDKPNWKQVQDFYENNNEWKQRLDRVKASSILKEELSSELAFSLYGQNSYQSVTKYEQYARCPFSYFLSYGLGAKPREEWQIRKLDIGNLCHWIIQNYCIRVSENASTIEEVQERWNALEESRSQQIVEELIAHVEKTTVARLLRSVGKIKSVLHRVRRSVMMSVDIINKSLKNGVYTVVACEKYFEHDLFNGDIKLRGIIDRVDIFEQRDKAYIRIIDYKSGNKAFDESNVYDMLDLQLAIYAMTAVELYKGHKFSPMQSSDITNVEMGGMLYEQVHDKIEKTENKGERGKLTGIIFADTDEDAYRMDDNLRVEESSSFLKLKLNEKGKLSGDSHTIGDVDILQRYAQIAMQRLNSDIYSGKILIQPYRKSTQTGCSFCEYGEVCLFEECRHSYRELYSERDRKNNAWECMKNELGEGDE